MNTARLTSSNGLHHLDWKDNLLGDYPPLVVNDAPRGKWSIFDIFLDVIRTTKPTFIKYNNADLQKKFLECHKSFMDFGYIHGFDVSQFPQLVDSSVKGINLCTIWQDILTVESIVYEY